MSDIVRIIDRRQTSCEKWDGASRRFGGHEVLPFWVADMDFASPDCVVSAIAARAAHGAYGYGHTGEEHAKAVTSWLALRHGAAVSPDHLVFSPGVVGSLRLCVRALTRPGDGIIIMPPVYQPFPMCIAENGRVVHEAPLIRSGESYTMNLPAVETALKAGCRMVILCSPHNPVGRVWFRAELEALLGLLTKYDAVLVSDEIHADFVMPGHRHVSSLTLPGARERVVALYSATKTFNIAGLSHSTAVFLNEEHRKAFLREGAACGALHLNIFGQIATTAAYNGGAAWVDNLCRIIDGNRAAVQRFAAEHGIGAAPMEGTYLMWLNMATLGIADGELETHFARAGVGLMAGYAMGTGGEGYMRMNIACPEPMLREGLARMSRAIRSR